MSIRWYDPLVLLNKMDRNGELAEIFISISNRGAGKTYGFSKYLLEEWEQNGKDFALLTRWKDDLGNVAQGVLKGYLLDAHPYWVVSEKLCFGGAYSEILITDTENPEAGPMKCGYVLPISMSTKLKKVSSEFIGICSIFFDEFQDDRYCPGEVDKFINLHATVARGGTAGVRRVPVILASNSLSIQNPYFVELGLTRMIQPDTKWFRGEGLVLERFVNEDVAALQKQSAFNRAFANNRQVQCNISNAWLNDDYALVSGQMPAWGRGQYKWTLITASGKYGVREFTDGTVWINRRVDVSRPSYTLGCNLAGVEDAAVNGCLPYLRGSLYGGMLLFSDLGCKTDIKKYL